jgi:flagellar L-ring protein precursor FlgH
MTRLAKVSFTAGMRFRLVLAGAVLLLGGCTTLSEAMSGKSEPLPPAQHVDIPPPPPPTPGAIFQAGPGLSLFEDAKARNVGDILTIQLVESFNSTTTGATDSSKKSDNTISAPTIFGMPVSIHGAAVLSGQLDSSSSFSGSGDSSLSNTLQGYITVTVVERLSNGNLLVRGDKHMELNRGVQDVRIQGIVRPADIAPDNSIPSYRLSDARVAYTTTGSISEANGKGWLSRFFSSPLMPF